jgi:hypothetical protein
VVEINAYVGLAWGSISLAGTQSYSTAGYREECVDGVVVLTAWSEAEGARMVTDGSSEAKLRGVFIYSVRARVC